MRRPGGCRVTLCPVNLLDGVGHERLLVMLLLQLVFALLQVLWDKAILCLVAILWLVFAELPRHCASLVWDVSSFAVRAWMASKAF